MTTVSLANRFRTDFGRDEIANGLIAMLFSATGPVAVILAVGSNAKLPTPVVASWIAAVFCINGLLTIITSLRSRQPLVFFFTIPGTVVVGQAMANGTTWPEVIGAFLMVAVLLILIAATGRVDQVMDLIPLPIVMAMVAGVFLSFGIGLVQAVGTDIVTAGPMVIAFVLVSAIPQLARRVPPVLAALIIGAVVVSFSSQGQVQLAGRWLVEPVVTMPAFSAASIVELVIPIAITVLIVQNGQGMAVLRGAGHNPPMGPIAGACGGTSLLTAPLGGVSTCLAGPSNALVVACGDRSRHYAGAVVCGAIAIAFGLFAPGMVRMITSMPLAYIVVLGGLAMLLPLQNAFRAAFSGSHPTGTLVTFLVTVAGVSFLGIGSAFWGLVAGMAIGRLLDRDSSSKKGST